MTTRDFTHLDALNARNAKGRKALAEAFTSIALEHGAAVEERHGEANKGFHGKSIDLTITLAGVGALLSIDDLHGGHEAIISWYNTRHPARQFTAQFNTAARDYGQFRPHHKATSIGTWGPLAVALAACLKVADCGLAFRQQENDSPSGRLRGGEPNLQIIPLRTPEVAAIRAAFIGKDPKA